MLHTVRRPSFRAMFAGASLTVMALAAAPAAAQTQTAAPTDVEEVVVQGLRESLARAVEVKRQASQVVDVITAEDVGKLPDDNVAEALQRVTGVQISRVFGEGQSVNVRGLQQVRVEVDGRTLLGWSARLSPPENEQLGRSSGLDSVPSGLFGRLEVRKSPVASQVEGGLGGSINMVTPDPFDFREPTFRYRLQGSYGEASEKIEPAVTFLATRRFLDDRLGLLVAVDYIARTATTQALERNDFFTTAGRDLNGDGTADLSGDRLQYEHFVTDRTRYGLTLEAQFEVTPQFQLYSEVIYSGIETERNQDFLVWRYAGNPVTNPVFQGNTILAGTSRGNLQQAGLYREEPSDSLLTAFGGEWESDRLKVGGEISFSIGTLDQQIRQITLQSLSSTINGAFDYRGGQVPSLDLGTFNITDYANYRPTEVRTNELIGQLDEAVGKFDVQWRAEAGMLKSISAGARYRQLNSFMRAFRSTATPTRDEIQPYLRVTNPGDFLPDVSGAFPRRFLTTVADVNFITQRALNGRPIGRNQARDYDLTETSWAGYVMADFEGQVSGLEVKANAGLRYVTTDLQVDTFLQTASKLVPVRDENEYSHLLPSANLTVGLSEDLLLRFAAAKVMQHPGVRELAPSIFVNETNRTATGGNAYLKPTTATQLDVSLEWYFAPGSILSGAVFWKDVKDFVAEETVLQTFAGFESFGPIPYTRPSNIGTAEIKGLEVGVQHFFTGLPAPFDGLGVIANYTYSDAVDQNGNPLVAVSKNSYNLIGLYEKGPISARIAYNYRDEALFSYTQGRPNFIGEVSQLDAQVAYKVSDRLTLQLQAVNLTPEDAATSEYSVIPRALNSYALSERRLVFGIRGRF